MNNQKAEAQQFKVDDVPSDTFLTNLLEKANTINYNFDP